MAIPHASSGEPVDVRPLGAALADTRNSALFKGRDLEVMRLVVPVGKRDFTGPVPPIAG